MHRTATTAHGGTRRRRLLSVVAAVLAGGAACASPPPEEAPVLRFGTVAAGEHDPATREWSVVAREGGRHEVTVRKAFDSVHPCPELHAQVLRVGTQITLRVTAREGGDDCASPGSPAGYEAVMDGLRTGHYDLRVVHVDDAPGQSAREVFRHALVVRGPDR